jgi:hypothetical protein
VKSVSQPMMEAPDTEPANLQLLPLEAVWAVETKRQPPGTFLPAPVESDNPISSAEEKNRSVENALNQNSVQRTVAQDQIVRNALQDVQPASASQSGIEFIPPRRPRPVPASAGSNIVARENVPPPAEQPSQGVLQRQADTSRRSKTAKPGVVPTEIGPLPEDLWSLVGAESPVERIERPQEPPAPIETSKWEQSSTSTGLPASPSGPVSLAPVVQRQVARGATAGPASAPPSAGGDDSEKQTGQDVNIEELARQVYSELKHRLGLEWERLRRR